jgi:heme exporter protein A
MSPSEGVVLWQDVPLQQNRDSFHEELLYLGHQSPLKPELSAIENIDFLFKLRGYQFSRTEIVRALNTWELQNKTLQLPIKYLSQGQKQRVVLAQLSITTQALWILDEPFNSLDQVGAAILSEHVYAHVAKQHSAILTSHLHDTCSDMEPRLQPYEKIWQF